MKKLKYPLYCLLAFALIGCEETIDVETSASNPSIVINAFIDDQPESQFIQVSYTRGFNEDAPYQAESGAQVSIQDITDPSQSEYTFEPMSEGIYAWNPATSTDTFGILNHEYKLKVVVDGKTFSSISKLNPVPPIDSVGFNFIERTATIDEGYIAEFFATDLAGVGDTYWVKTYQNHIFLDQPEYLLTSIDGAFAQTDQDGMLFVPPIRRGINPIERDNIGYEVGDTVGVELLSITLETYNYLNEIRAQTDRAGGISELFSVPITNLTGNIYDDQGNRVLGFFSISSSSYMEQVLTEALAERALSESK